MYLTTMGMYQYLKSDKDDLFKYMSLPEGIDKQVLIDNILLESDAFEVIYTNALIFQHAIGTWSTKYQNTFKRWLEGVNAEYNPVENYDRFEDWTDELDRNITSHNDQSINDSGKISGQSNTDGTNRISAFDSDVMVDDNSSSVTGTNTNETISNSNVDANGSESVDERNVHSARIHGNIGVTTAPKMLKEHYEISKWNIIDAITELFLAEFCIRTY